MRIVHIAFECFSCFFYLCSCFVLAPLVYFCIIVIIICCLFIYFCVFLFIIPYFLLFFLFHYMFPLIRFLSIVLFLLFVLLLQQRGCLFCAQDIIHLRIAYVLLSSVSGQRHDFGQNVLCSFLVFILFFILSLLLVVSYVRVFVFVPVLYFCITAIINLFLCPFVSYLSYCCCYSYYYYFIILVLFLIWFICFVFVIRLLLLLLLIHFSFAATWLFILRKGDRSFAHIIYVILHYGCFCIDFHYF